MLYKCSRDPCRSLPLCEISQQRTRVLRGAAQSCAISPPRTPCHLVLLSETLQLQLVPAREGTFCLQKNIGSRSQSTHDMRSQDRNVLCHMSGCKPSCWAIWHACRLLLVLYKRKYASLPECGTMTPFAKRSISFPRVSAFAGPS